MLCILDGRHSDCKYLRSSTLTLVIDMQYNTWAGFDEDSDEFWTSEATKQMYKDHIKTVVNRVNSLNGKPVILK